MYYTISNKEADEICEMVYDHGFKAYDRVVKKFEGLLSQSEQMPVGMCNSTTKPHVGDSAFEDWFQVQPFALQSGIKQISRDSYAAGMGDPLVNYAAHPAPFAPIVESDVTDEMLEDFRKDAKVFLSPAAFAAVINIWKSKERQA